MPNPMHALHRAMADITLGVVKSTRSREQRDREMGLSEVMQQFQVAIEGTATGVLTFAQVEVDFDYPMYYAPGQRDSDFDRPQFWVGAEANEPVAVTATVDDWVLDDDNGAVTGASVQIGVMAGVTTTYKGKVHMTFQGFAALSEPDPT